MAKKLISYDDEAEGLGLPDVVEAQLNEAFARTDDILVSPTNLFDPTRVTKGVVIPSGSVTPTPNDDYWVTDPIPVTAGTNYTIRYVLRATWLGSSGTLIGNPDSASGGDPSTTTAPAGATHVRLSVRSVFAQETQMNEGSELLPYESGVRKIDSQLLDLSVVAPAGDYIVWPVAPGHTSFFHQTSNLFDPSQATEGLTLPYGTGTPTAHKDYWLSGLIPILPDTDYAYGGAYRATYFDVTGEYISVDTLYSNYGEVWTSPVTAATVRLSIHRNHISSAQMNLGSKLLQYERGGYRLDRALLPDPETVDISTTSPFMTDTSALGEVFDGPIIEAQPNIGQETPADVYSRYDALVADHPDYITRRDLGVVSDGETHMYAYSLKAPEVPSVSTGDVSDWNMTPIPVALLISSVHGYERPSVYYLWRFAKALCEEWRASPVLDAIRWNFEIVIVPLGNPHSYKPDAAPSTRQNANGVDIARNFEAGWGASTPGTSTYSGTHPLSEPESQYLDALMREMGPRCVLGASFHNFSTPVGNPWAMIWQASASDWTLNLGKQLVSRMSRKWNVEQEWIESPHLYYGYADRGAPPGSEGRAFVSHGIQGSTFETSRLHRLATEGDGVNNTSEAMTLGYEATVNYISLGLYQAMTSK